MKERIKIIFRDDKNSTRRWGGSEEWTWIMRFIRHGYSDIFISRIEQQRVAPTLHCDNSVVTYLEPGSSPVAWTNIPCTFTRHIPFAISFLWGIHEKQGLYTDVTTSLLAWCWMCNSPQTGYAQRVTLICNWREQAIVEWFRRVISIVACCHTGAYRG